MSEYNKKFKGNNRDYERPKRKEFGQEFEYKRKDEKEPTNQSSDYVEKTSKPVAAEPSQPEMKEAEPEARSDYPKKKRGSGFGFNSSFGNKQGKFGGQDKWANDKKTYDEEQDPAQNEHQSGDYAYKTKQGYNKQPYKKENLTYYERKPNNEAKVEPDYYKGTDFDDIQKESAPASKNSAPINWNTQNKRRQDTESDDYEDDGHHKRDAGYNSKYYKKFQPYKNYYDEPKRAEHYPKHRDQKYQDYEEPEKYYKSHNHHHEDDYYNEEKPERYEKYHDKGYKGGQGSKYNDRKYQHEGKREREGYDYNDRHAEEAKPAQTQAPVPERRMGGREFKLPTPEDLKKQEVVETKKKDTTDKARAPENSTAEEANKHKKADYQNDKPGV